MHPYTQHDVDSIRRRLRRAVADGTGVTDCVRYFAQVDSTNAYLAANAAGLDLPNGAVCLADYQTHGRGRRGRRWQAPPGSAVMLSMWWVWARDDRQWMGGGVSLAVGLAVVQVLRRLTALPVWVKWPNDVLLDGGKLGGVLVEADARRVVIGVGVNVAAVEDAPRGGDAVDAVDAVAAYRRADLRRACRPVARDALAAELIIALQAALRRFEQDGFGVLREEWNRYHALHNQPVQVIQAAQCVSGIVRGVGADGALRVEVAGQMLTFYSGEVSVRPGSF